MELEALNSCPVCGGGNNPHIIFLHDRRVSGETLHYASCQGCGQLFLTPRMSDAQTAEYYAGAYRTGIWGADGYNEVDQTTQRLRASLQAQVLNLWNVVPDNVLEIGSGAGYLLWEWHKRGAKVVGIEPDARCREREPGKRFKMLADIAELEPQPFELICLSHVLEHLNHPREYLQDLIAKYAGPQTQLMIEVPNSECNLSAFQIHHPMAFTGHSLDRLMEGLGYKMVQRLYHGLANTEIQRYYLALYAPQTEGR